MYLKATLIALVVTVLSSCQTKHESSLPVIKLKDRENRQFTYTNKRTGFFLGNSHRENVSGHAGWTVNEHKYLKDYRLFINNIPVLRDSIRSFEYDPTGFTRTYPAGLTERLVFPDSLDAVLVILESDYDLANLVCELVPHQVEKGVLLKISADYNRIILSPAMLQASTSAGIQWMGAQLVTEQDNRSLLIITLGKDEPTLLRNLKYIRRYYRELITTRQQRITGLLSRNRIIIDDPDIANALEWAQISLDALITEQRGKGIWAGLPWFNNYWARDTFISFAGALLVTGQFKEAKAILSNFAAFQLNNEKDSWHGRIPNRITNNEVIYNTADGTWWFIRELWEYILYSGDEDYAKEIFPVLKKAVQGALKHRVDAFYFLTHEDADTWMDARGPDGAWSPRGNRAVEIQALWYTALQIGSRIAKMAGNSETAVKWLEISQQLRGNFNRLFYRKTKGWLYDHLNRDGSRDKKIRPNQIFAVSVPALPGIEPLIESEPSASVSSTVLTRLTYPYGVASLWQMDEDFHPWHHYEPYYVQDEAYHNGTVWTWLAGPVISSLLRFNRQDVAFQLFANEAFQILNWDAIGNYSELLDALPREGEKYPRISGTVSQAWSLAEFTRNFYQDFVGFHPDAPKRRFIFRPQFISQLQNVSCRLPFMDTAIRFDYRQDDKNIFCRITIEKIPVQPLEGMLAVPGFEAEHFVFDSDYNRFEIILPLSDRSSFKQYNELDWYFARVELQPDLPALKGPDYDLLKTKDCYFKLPGSAAEIIRADDPQGDDHGLNRKYTYPANVHFKPGIFDLRSVSIYDADDAWGFRIKMQALSNPNWHPAYGFQLTFLAIAIGNTDQKPAGKTVGKGAGLVLPGRRAYQRIIYIGGGMEVRDFQDKILAQYLPGDPEFPLGFENSGEIRFMIPKSYLPDLNDNSVITVLSGGQDDHGGAGIGEFREVRDQRGAWHGGGADRKQPVPRIYDMLEIN